jgi:hypothetical protein
MQTMSFEDWVRAWFNHPEDWDWVSDDDLPELSNTDTLAYATQLFQNAGVLLSPYSDTQVGNSLWAFINEMNSPLYALQDAEQPVAVRIACLESIFSVSKEIFAVRATEALGHCNEMSGKLNITCYMWWDIFPLHQKARPELDAIVLTLMERTLALPHAACQESALHGLGHWQPADPKRVQGIIDAFLAAKKAHRPELVAYAKSARSGMVL